MVARSYGGAVAAVVDRLGGSYHVVGQHAGMDEVAPGFVVFDLGGKDNHHSQTRLGCCGYMGTVLNRSLLVIEDHCMTTVVVEEVGQKGGLGRHLGKMLVKHKDQILDGCSLEMDDWLLAEDDSLESLDEVSQLG